MLSNGEFVVRAEAAARHRSLLHAINAGAVPAFADGGFVQAARARRASWLSFFRRPLSAGGLGAPRHVALGATAMLNGESGWGLNPAGYRWDVNGPSGGTAQWHDVTVGRLRGRVNRLSELAAFATRQYVDWTRDPAIQQAFFKREAMSSMYFAWRQMLKQRSAAGVLRKGIDLYENPANHDFEYWRRLPNINRLARENSAPAPSPIIDPIRLDIHHHADGRTSVRAKSGRGVVLNMGRGPVMREM